MARRFITLGVYDISSFHISIDSSGHVCHWHVSTKKCLTTVKEERHTLAVQFAPDYLTFATTGSNAKIIVYDEPTNAIKTVLEPRLLLILTVQYIYQYFHHQLYHS